MISAQTRSAFVAKESRYPAFGLSPEGKLFRIMLWGKAGWRPQMAAGAWTL
jgi:hypothetical protein